MRLYEKLKKIKNFFFTIIISLQKKVRIKRFLTKVKVRLVTMKNIRTQPFCTSQCINYEKTF